MENICLNNFNNTIEQFVNSKTLEQRTESIRLVYDLRPLLKNEGILLKPFVEECTVKVKEIPVSISLSILTLTLPIKGAIWRREFFEKLKQFLLENYTVEHVDKDLIGLD